MLTGLSTPETQAIQIAVIDDGFDISESLYSSKVSRGVSYLPTEFAESGISASWFIPVSGHGTIMAALICSICPMARLYLAKIPVGPSVANSNHRDSTEAAAKVTPILHPSMQAKADRAIKGRPLGTGLRCGYHLHGVECYGR